MGFRHNTNVTTEKMFEEMREFLLTAAGVTNIGQASVGDGTLIDHSATGVAVAETYQLTATTIGPTATFTVVGGTTGAHPDAVSNTPYSLVDGTVAFTITDGTTAWEVGDVITFEVQIYMGDKPLWTNPSGGDFVNSIQSSRGLEYIPNNNGMRVVEGRYPDTKGIKFERIDTGARRYDVEQEQASYPEMSIDNGYPRAFTLSFWADETAGTFDCGWEAKSGYVYDDVNAAYARWWNYGSTLVQGLVTSGLEDKCGIWCGLSAAAFHETSMLYYASYNSCYPHRITWLSSSYLYNARLSSIAYPWNLYCLAVDTVAGTVSLMINGVTQGTGRAIDITNRWPNIFEIGDTGSSRMDAARAPIGLIFDELVIWDGSLTDAAATELYNRAVSVTPSTILASVYNVWEKVTNVVTSDIGGGYFSNVADNGHLLEIGFNATNQALHLSAALAVPDEPYANTKQYKLGSNSNYDYYFNMRSYYCKKYYTPEGLSNRTVTHLIRGLAEQVESYWIVADNNRIIILTKYFDASTPKKVPIYLLSYIGQLDDLGDNGPQVVIAGNYNGDTDWFSSADSIRFGGTYGQRVYDSNRGDWYTNKYYWDMNNFVAYRWEEGWKYYDFSTDYGVNHDTIYPYNNYFTTWDLILGGPIQDQDLNDPDLTGDLTSNFGRFAGLVSLGHNNINAGDLLNIKGLDYIVFQDGNRTDAASIMALRLN